MAEARLVPPGEGLPFARLAKGPWIDLWLLLTVAMLAGIGIAHFATGILAWWLALISPLLGFFIWHDWRYRSQESDGAQLYARHGWWRQNLDIARAVNVQSVTVSQGPISRRRGVANVEFGIAGGTLSFTALPIETARAIRDQVMTVIAPVDFSELNRRD
jgi:putative membrane protein